MNWELSFLGAAGTVTGSRFLLHVKRHHYLVDCGLFQGERRLKDMNWEPFPLPPEQLDAILLTHAHIDHTGYLPRLVHEGYRGPVYATEATCALLEILLLDSAHLQEQDAAYANQKGYSHHKPALPLYTVADAYRALERLHPVPFHQPLPLNGVTVTWRPAGHILGSALLELTVDADGDRPVVFSGDLGRYDQEVMKPPYPVEVAEDLVIESTYGGRSHTEAPIEDTLEAILRTVIEQRGVLLIPAFAVGRTQQVIYYLRKLQEQDRIPAIPIYVDSPMASDVTHIYCRFGDDHNLDVNLLMDGRVCPLRCRDTRFVRDVNESKALNTMSGPAVILSANGMCTGGRILHHLKWRLPDPHNAVLFVGYQAEGTRGRLLLDGAKRIRIHGQEVPVRARVFHLDALSAHADQHELLRWLGGFERPPRQTFVVHGEQEASRTLADVLQARRWAITVPNLGKAFSLG